MRFGVVRTARERPLDLVSPWPEGETSDPAGEIAKEFARSLKAAIGDRSIRSVGIACGVNHETVRAILHGRVWPDMLTIARLERGLETRLWPH